MAPNLSYFLTSPRLGFRTWSTEDLPLAQSLSGQSRRHQNLRRPLLRIPNPRTPRPRNRQPTRPPSPILARLSSATGEFTGCCGLRPYDLEKQIFELGFHFLPNYWGKGLATEAAQTVIAYAFGPLALKGLFAGHHPENAASARVLQKLGFLYTHNVLYPPTKLLNPSYFLAPPP